MNEYKYHNVKRDSWELIAKINSHEAYKNVLFPEKIVEFPDQ